VIRRDLKELESLRLVSRSTLSVERHEGQPQFPRLCRPFRPPPASLPALSRTIASPALHPSLVRPPLKYWSPSNCGRLGISLFGGDLKPFGPLGPDRRRCPLAAPVGTSKEHGVIGAAGPGRRGGQARGLRGYLCAFHNDAALIRRRPGSGCGNEQQRAAAASRLPKTESCHRSPVFSSEACIVRYPLWIFSGDLKEADRCRAFEGDCTSIGPPQWTSGCRSAWDEPNLLRGPSAGDRIGAGAESGSSASRRPRVSPF